VAANSSKPVLVLLPGLDGTGKLFEAFVQSLDPGQQTQIVRYPVDLAQGYAELETLVRAALPTDRPYVLLGESFSGPIAIRIAADPPPGLVAVVLCVTFARNPYPMLAWAAPFAAAVPMKSLPAWLRAPLMWGSLSPDAAPAAAERATAGVDASVLQHRIAAVLSVDETAALTRIRIPVLVLQARVDHVVPGAATRHLLQHLPSALHVEIDGPHLLLQTKARECAEAIARFIAGDGPR
jgi:pimeloyl-ACP methyl ester carboxylesterase